MKNTGKCPKCNSTEIFVRKGFKHSKGYNIMLGSTSFSEAPIDHYICKKCGYIEQWLRDVEILKNF